MDKHYIYGKPENINPAHTSLKSKLSGDQIDHPEDHNKTWDYFSDIGLLEDLGKKTLIRKNVNT